ncbi:MAG: DUF3276 family protein [Crocinitomicaceae bacterium]|nr:DUF3276 family protein [Crocinitomicaceae bacterium]
MYCVVNEVEMEEGKNTDRRDELYSNAIRAGKRTYFFDVKCTKGNDLYITVTESKKSTNNGRVNYQKHKIFLYKEDFEKFREGLEDALAKVDELKDTSETIAETYTSVSFEELG